MPETEDPFGPFNSDGEAIQFLESRHYLCIDGTIIPPGPGYVDKPDETMAIGYLVAHWDWHYEKL
jgi:hypothetical protein